MGIFIIDGLTHQIVDSNAAANEMFGRLPDGAKLTGLCHEFVCEKEAGKCPITDLHQDVNNKETVLITSSGDRKPILKTVVPITLNKRLHLIESFIDISERKKVEEALRESEIKYRRIFESLGGPLLSNR